MEAPLSQREFDTWREGDNDFKKDMRDFIAAQVQLNLSTEKRVTRVEEKLDSSDRRIAVISSLIASVVGVLGGFFGAKV